MKKRDSHEKERIGQAFALARAEKPAYAYLYPFLEDLFLLRAASRNTLNIDPVRVDPQQVRTRWDAGFPLIRRWDFPVDAHAAGALLTMLGGSIPEANEQIKSAHSALSRSLAVYPGLKKAIWQSFLQHEMEPWEEWVDTGGVDVASLLFLARSCLRPAIERGAEELLSRFPVPDYWLKGYCPICGSLPSLLFLEGEGERKAYCSWCGTVWGLNRFQCCHCDNRLHDSLGYLYVEAEPQYRIQYCNRCNFYFKLIQAKEMAYPPYPALEEWTTLHLDLLAQRAGLKQAPSPSPVIYGNARS